MEIKIMYLDVSSPIVCGENKLIAVFPETRGDYDISRSLKIDCRQICTFLTYLMHFSHPNAPQLSSKKYIHGNINHDNPPISPGFFI